MNVSSVHLRPLSGRVKRPATAAAFTLVEILVSMFVLTILLLVSAQVIGQVQNTWAQSNARVSQFREARTAFDIITRNLSQATLNTYVDYQTNYLEGATVTAVSAADMKYLRKSDLQFRCGKASALVGGGAMEAPYLPGHAVFFQAPLGVAQQANLVGLDRLLCGRGYFVQYSSDEFFMPAFLPSGSLRYRYRLMEFCPPAEKNTIYSNPPTGGNAPDAWYANSGAPLNKDETPINLSVNRPVADNILALIVSPQVEGKPGDNASKTKIAPNYDYNSCDRGVTLGASSQGTQHMLPPMVRVVLIAIDERSAERLAATSNGETTPPLGGDLNAFSNADSLDKELEQLQVTLRKKKINFRVFSAMVQLRGAKWST